MKVFSCKSFALWVLLGILQGAGWIILVFSIFAFYLISPFVCIWVAIRFGVWIGGTSGVAIGLFSLIAMAFFAGSLQDRELGIILGNWGDRYAGMIDRLNVIQGDVPGSVEKLK